MKAIPLTRGYVALVDDADYEWASQWKWYAKPQTRGDGCYAARNERGVDRLRRRTIRLHRELIAAPDDMDVDHINGNTLDNRRCNLRVCTTAENTRNRIGYRRRSAPKGVRLRRGRWEARIVRDYKHFHLGSFATEAEAVAAYNAAGERLHGAFARPSQATGHLSSNVG